MGGTRRHLASLHFFFSGALFWGSVGEGRGVEALCDGGEGGCVVVKEGGVGGVHQ